MRSSYSDVCYSLLDHARHGPTAATEDPPVEKFLVEGKLADGEKALASCRSQTDGCPSSLQSGRDPVRGSGRADGSDLSPLRPACRRCWATRCRLPGFRFPPIQAPEPIRYADLRALFQRWNDDLAKADATLAKVGFTRTSSFRFTSA